MDRGPPTVRAGGLAHTMRAVVRESEAAENAKVPEHEPEIADGPGEPEARPPLSAKTGADKRERGGTIPFVLAVYAASRLFYLIAGPSGA